MLPETPQQTARRCLRELRDSLRRAGLRSLRHHEDIDGLRLTIGAKRVKARSADCADLPADLWTARPSMKETFRAIVAIRKALGDAARVRPVDIVAWLDREHQSVIHSVDTVNHALRDLRSLKLAWAPDEKGADKRGWRLGAPPGLPILGRQTDAPSETQTRGYALHMAGEWVRRIGEKRVLNKSHIWVPGERDEESDCVVVVIVTDARTERQFGVAERLGEMKVPNRLGSLRTVHAVRAELVRPGEKYATARLPTGEEIAVRVLGPWHLDGLTEPAREGTETEVA